MFAVPRETGRAHPRVVGTTGKPTVVGYTTKDIDTWATVMARSIRAAGGRAGDIVHVAYGYGLFTGGLGAHYGAEKLGCTVIPMSGGKTERQVQLITDFKPDIIMVTPSYMLAIAEEMERQGIDPRANVAQDRHLRRRAVDADDAQARSKRGSTSTRSTSTGCRKSWVRASRRNASRPRTGSPSGRIISIPEIVDPQTGDVLPDGEKGELVFTSLTKEALPIIRYRTRDLTRLLPPTARSMRRMEKITGRSDDMLIIRGVNVFPTQVEELILKQAALAPHYQLESRVPSSLDEMTVLVEMCAELAQSHADARHAAARSLEQNIKGYIGVSTTVLLASPGGIERSVGKAKRVVDKRSKD